MEIWATRPFFLFEYFRVPYRIASGGGPEQREGWGTLGVNRADGSSATLSWPLAERLGERMSPPRHLHLGPVAVWARTVPDAEIRQLAPDPGAGWRPAEGLRDGAGRGAASVWRDDRGNVALPFDPGEAIQALWREDYLGARRRAASDRALRAYYRLRPVLPRALQLGLRRGYRRLQRRAAFPAWPAETALHDLCGRLFEELSRLGEGLIPHIAPWPDAHTWAFVLTHDVETGDGYGRIPTMRDLERSLDYRSSWNLVVDDYEVEDSLVEGLDAEGFEVGVHGLRHDGGEFASLEEFRARVPEVRRRAERWGAKGYRSPSTLRVWEWMPALGLDYDSSYSDTAPFEPQAGGCCSLLPFFNEDLVELPITMPQDHTMFVILGESDERLWREKAELVRERGGMALMLTHPDYMTGDRLEAYRRVLEAYREDAGAWRALPREVSEWWRARAASHLEPDGDGWRVVGPAAGRARVAFA